MPLSQWLALGALLLLIGGIAFLFVRKGSIIRPAPDSKQGDMTGGGGDPPSSAH